MDVLGKREEAVRHHHLANIHFSYLEKNGRFECLSLHEFCQSLIDFLSRREWQKFRIELQVKG
jgi:regulator of sigma D